MKKYWLIIQRNKDEYDEDGIRWKASPVININNLKQTLDIFGLDEENKNWRIAEEIERGIEDEHVEQIVEEHFGGVQKEDSGLADGGCGLGGADG